MEYIEKKAALDAIWQGCGACAEEVKQLPVVEIVRCEDCANMQEDDIFHDYWCDGRKVQPDDFCSRGVRKGS